MRYVIRLTEPYAITESKNFRPVNPASYNMYWQMCVKCDNGTKITLRSAQSNTRGQALTPDLKASGETFNRGLKPTLSFDRCKHKGRSDDRYFYLETYQFVPRYYPRGHCGARHQRYCRHTQSLGYYQGLQRSKVGRHTVGVTSGTFPLNLA
jgi:hypothetical protein